MTVFANESGISKFIQGLAIEIFILALYALSYDVIFGITGLLSFGHSMFFAVGAYLTEIALKSFQLSLPATLALLFIAVIVQAMLFGLVLPRVKGITFALVTLGMGSVFHIVVMSSEAGKYTGADVGLQGVIVPAFIGGTDERLRFYFIALTVLILVYLLYQRFIDSPTGRVCIAIRENEGRAQMLGYNTFYFKLAALLLSSFTAALAGFCIRCISPLLARMLLAWDSLSRHCSSFSLAGLERSMAHWSARLSIVCLISGCVGILAKVPALSMARSMWRSCCLFRLGSWGPGG